MRGQGWQGSGGRPAAAADSCRGRRRAGRVAPAGSTARGQRGQIRAGLAPAACGDNHTPRRTPSTQRPCLASPLERDPHGARETNETWQRGGANGPRGRGSGAPPRRPRVTRTGTADWPHGGWRGGRPQTPTQAPTFTSPRKQPTQAAAKSCLPRLGPSARPPPGRRDGSARRAAVHHTPRRTSPSHAAGGGATPLARAEISFPNTAAGAAACHPPAAQARPARSQQVGGCAPPRPAWRRAGGRCPNLCWVSRRHGRKMRKSAARGLEGVSHPGDACWRVPVPARIPPSPHCGRRGLSCRAPSTPLALHRAPCTAESARRRKCLWARKRRLAGNPPQFLNQAAKERSRTAPPP